jgi:paraquat-inducible protein B
VDRAIVAVLFGAVLLVNTLTQAGPRVVIEFRTAEGLGPARPKCATRRWSWGASTA